MNLKHFWHQHSLIILTLLLALGLRLPQLNGSFWLDEAAQALESARPLSQQLQIAADFQPPLIHLILFLAMKISAAEWWLRTIGALIPGLVTIWATYEIGKRQINLRAGLMTALLLATSSFHIFYSQELRPYALPAMWAVLSWLPLLKASEQTHFSPKPWRQYALISLLGFYSSYLYPFLWLTQCIWLIWQHRSKTNHILGSALLVGLGFLPWLPSFLEQLRVGSQLRTTLPGWENVVSISQLKGPLLVAGKFIFGVLDLEFNTFFIAISVFLIGILLTLIFFSIIHLKKSPSQKTLKNSSLFILWTLLPLLLAWIVSFWVPVIRPKRLLFMLPGAYLLLSQLTFLPATPKQQSRGMLVVGILLALNLWGVVQYQLNPWYQRENWRGLYQEISENYDPSQTILLFSYPNPFSPWKWYARNKYPTLTTDHLYIKDNPDLAQTLKTVTEYRYVLLFDYLRDLTDPDDQLRSELWSLGFHEINALDYPHIGFIRVFTKYQPMAAVNIKY